MVKRGVALLCLVAMIFGSAVAEKVTTSRTNDWNVDPAAWMGSCKGLTVHETKIRDAEPSDWGEVSANGVLMINGGYIGIIKIKHTVYRVDGSTKTKIASKNFTVNVVPQTVKITKIFEVRPGDLQVRWGKVDGADWYIVALGQGKNILQVRKTISTSKDFNGLDKGSYWAMVCAVTDIWGTELSSRASRKVKVTIYDR